MATGTLITGSTGLIGRWVRRAWDESTGGPLTLLQSATHDLLAAGAANRFLTDLSPDRVIHLAWCASGTSNYRTSADNEHWLEATLDITTACREAEVDLWLTGSVLDRGDAAADAYVAAKQELFARVGEQISAGALGWIRPYYVFDEAARRPALVAQAIRARATSEPVVLRTPEATHDFVHAADVGSAIALAVAAGVLGEIDVGTSTSRRVGDLVRAMGVSWERATGTPTTDRATSSPAADPAALLALGWQPTRTEEFFTR